MNEIEEIRRMFPALSCRRDGRKLIYFDNACSVLKPQCVIDAVNSWMTENGSCGGGRSSHALSADTDELCSRARANVAEFAGAAPEEIIFTQNTTEGINIVAGSLPFFSGKDEVLLHAAGHNSLLLPFAGAAEKGLCRIKLCGTANPLCFDENEILENITEKTALVALPLASNVTGSAFCTDKIIRKARIAGAYVLCDAAAFLPVHCPCWKDGKNKYGGIYEHGSGNILLNSIVPDMYEMPDFIAFSGHKAGALPIGALACRRELFHILKSPAAGGGTVAGVSFEKGKINVRHLEGYKRHEAGIQNYPGIISFGAAAAFADMLDRRKICSHVSVLSEMLLSELEKIPEISAVNSKNEKNTAIVSFFFKDSNISAQDFNLYLNSASDANVCIRAGRHCAMLAHDIAGIKETVRASFYIYNMEEEINIFVKLLRGFLSAAA